MRKVVNPALMMVVHLETTAPAATDGPLGDHTDEGELSGASEGQESTRSVGSPD